MKQAPLRDVELPSLFPSLSQHVLVLMIAIAREMSAKSFSHIPNQHITSGQGSSTTISTDFLVAWQPPALWQAELMITCLSAETNNTSQSTADSPSSRHVRTCAFRQPTMIDCHHWRAIIGRTHSFTASQAKNRDLHCTLLEKAEKAWNNE